MEKYVATYEGLPDPRHKVVGGDGKTFLNFSGEEYMGCLLLTLPQSGASEKGNTMEVRAQMDKSQWKGKSWHTSL